MFTYTEFWFHTIPFRSQIIIVEENVIHTATDREHFLSATVSPHAAREIYFANI